MGKIFGREPALVMGVVQTGIALALALGLFTLTATQVGLVLGFTAALLSFVVRAKVTPVDN